MLRFDPDTQKMTKELPSADESVREIYVKLTGGLNHQRGILYESASSDKKSALAVAVIHSDDDYSDFPIVPALARRGYRAFGGQVTGQTLDEKLLDVKRVVEFLQALPGVEKVILLGHSGGATLMTAYQRAAEQGVASLKGEEMLWKCTLDEELPPVDGVVLLDANWGNCAMTLFSIDPAVMEENCGMGLEPSLDPFRPENGFDPTGSHYSVEFLERFFAAQAVRNDRVVDTALERLRAIKAGEGLFEDDEPFIVAGAAQLAPCNKLFPQDTALFAHTRGEYDLIHADGSVTHEIVRSLRRPQFDRSPTPQLMAAVQTTVRGFLSERAVYALTDYRFREDGVQGVGWDNVYSSAVPNVRRIHVPLLCMGMTGGYEYLASEEIFQNAASTDKSIAFVEGAGHNFTPVRDAEEFDGQFGDTERLVFDHVDRWLSAPGRFLG